MKFFQFLMCIVVMSGPTFAIPQIPKGALIRDTEIESALESYLDSIKHTMGIRRKIRVYVLSDPNINAFATEGNLIVINSGLLFATEHVGQLISVLAHELGHLEGGHIMRQKGTMNQSGKFMLMGGVLGAAALLAGSPGLAMGSLMGAGEFAKQNILRHSRSHESSADEFMIKAFDQKNWSLKGGVEFMNVLKSQELFSSAAESSYARTHPLTQDRVRRLDYIANTQSQTDPFPKEFETSFRRIRAKLSAFLGHIHHVKKTYASKTTTDALYAQAILSWRLNQKAQALKTIETLITKYPKDPYIFELKGQLLYEYGDIHPATQNLEKAYQVSRAPLIGAFLCQVYLEQGNYQKAKGILFTLNKKDIGTEIYIFQAAIYSHEKNPGRVHLALAQKAFEENQLDLAEKHLKIAQPLLNKKETSAMIQAEDLKLALTPQGR